MVEAAIPISCPGLVVDRLLQDISWAVQVLYLGQVQVQQERLGGLLGLLRYLQVDGVQVRGSQLLSDNKVGENFEKTEQDGIVSDLKDVSELFEPNCNNDVIKKDSKPYENKDLNAIVSDNNTDIAFKSKFSIQHVRVNESSELQTDEDADGGDDNCKPNATDTILDDKKSVFTNNVCSNIAPEVLPAKGREVIMWMGKLEEVGHKKRKPYEKQCEDCDYKADTENRWSYHRNVHQNIEYSCDLCDFKSKRKQLVLFHKISKHDIGERFDCQNCEKSFNRPHSLNNHQRYVHEGVEPPPKLKPKTSRHCKKCGFKAKSLHFLNVHLKEQHPELLLTCEMCGFTTLHESKFKEHKDNVHDGITFKCSHCESVLRTKTSRRVHEKLLHGVKQYLCSECDNKFSTRGYLRLHEERDHEGKRYNCDICGHLAKSKHHLKIHKQCKHFGVKYTCDVNDCNAIYSQKENLANHKKTKHEGVRYLCTVEGCEYKGSKKSLVLKHKRIVHDGVVYACPKCNYKAGRPEHLKTHMKKHPFNDEMTNVSMTKFRTIKLR